MIPNTLNEDFLGFPQNLQANARIILQHTDTLLSGDLKQQMLLGNAHNIYASNNRGMVFLCGPCLWVICRTKFRA
jgi:hypothetical protein